MGLVLLPDLLVKTLLVSENPAPKFMENLPPTPNTTVKSCGIVGLQRKPRSPCENVSNNMKRTMSNQDSEPFSLFSKKPKFSSQPQQDTFYNGFGGHSKSDNYPSAKK